MKKAFLIFLFVGFCFAEEESEPEPTLQYLTEMVEEIKKKATTWEPMDPKKNPFRKYTKKQLELALGIPETDSKTMNESRTTVKESFIPPELFSFTTLGAEEGIAKTTATAYNLPENYNWMEQSGYKECMPPVGRQGICGNCYAFTSSTVFSVRYCIAKAKKSGGVKTMIEFSPQDLTSCNVLTNQCSGGSGDYAHQFMEDYGITTEACQPYLEEKNTGTKATPCNPTSCNPTSKARFEKYFCKKGTSIQLTGRDQMKYEIWKYGPIYASMTVYEDFVNYKDGIYKRVSGNSMGGHAIVLLGWGKQDNVEYWYARNSWGDQWGMQGYFNIDMNDPISKVVDYGYYCIPEV